MHNVMSCCALLTEITSYGVKTEVIKLCVLLKEGSVMVFSQLDSGWLVTLANWYRHLYQC